MNNRGLTVDELLAQFPPEIGDVALEVRDVVFDVLDDPEERVYNGWKGLGYHTDQGYIGGIFLTPEGVTLLFEHGVELDDPEGELLGDGSQTRYVDVSDWDADTEQTARRFLVAALERAT